MGRNCNEKRTSKPGPEAKPSRTAPRADAILMANFEPTKYVESFVHEASLKEHQQVKVPGATEVRQNDSVHGHRSEKLAPRRSHESRHGQPNNLASRRCSAIPSPRCTDTSTVSRMPAKAKSNTADP